MSRSALRCSILAAACLTAIPAAAEVASRCAPIAAPTSGVGSPLATPDTTDSQQLTKLQMMLLLHQLDAKPLVPRPFVQPGDDSCCDAPTSSN